MSKSLPASSVTVQGQWPKNPMTNLLFITPMSLLASFAKRALRAWQDKRHVRRTVTIAILTWLATYLTVKGQDFHLQTNITQVPCTKVYYYGVLPDGGVQQIAFALDHNVSTYETALREGKSAFDTIFRVNAPLDMDGIAVVKHARPRTLTPATVMPSLPPPMPVPLQHKALSVPAPVPPQPYPTTAASDEPVGLSADGTPPYPSITNYHDLPFKWQCRNNMGEFYDPLGSGVTSNRLEATWWPSSGSYSTWWYCTNDVAQATNWYKFPDSASCPTASETNIFYLPILSHGPARFYWLRGS